MFEISNLNTSDWQHIAYCSVIIIFLSASIFSRQEMTLTKTLKYILIWVVIGIFSILLYSYRYKFIDFKNQIITQINPSKAILKDNQLIINLASDGHFYLDIKINQNPVRFMIDTGASDIILNLRDAQRVGLNIDQLIFNKPYQTANGMSFGASVRLKEIKISQIEFNDIYASVNKNEMGTSLLGMAFLKKFKKYEVYQDKLILSL
jgi:aspartyl protease family protein